VQLRDTKKFLQGEELGVFWVILGEKRIIWVKLEKWNLFNDSMPF
jgi:hypothetical protein